MILMFYYSGWFMYACGAILTALFILKFSESPKKTRKIRAIGATVIYLAVFALYLWALTIQIEEVGIGIWYFSVVPLCSLILTGLLLNKNIL